MVALKKSDLISKTTDLPEERLALNWSSRLELKYPVNIAEVIGKFATVTIEPLPITADAILFKKGPNPNETFVFVSDSIPVGRRNFTLAHELGHILIPWHTGSFVCAPMEIETPDDYENLVIFQEMEYEANRFAAEFLMPFHWLYELFDKFGTPARVVGKMMEAGLSRIAASIRVIALLPPNMGFLELDQSGLVVRSIATKNTIWKLPAKGYHWDPAILPSGASSEAVDGRGHIHFLDFRKVHHKRDQLPENSDWRQLLDEILEGHNDSEAIKRRISGIVGFAKNKSTRTQIDLYTILMERMKDFDKDVVRHPRFSEFLQLRATSIELASKAKGEE